MECRDRIYCLGLGGRRNSCFFVEIVAGLRARAIRKQMKIQRLALCVSCLFRETEEKRRRDSSPRESGEVKKEIYKTKRDTMIAFTTRIHEQPNTFAAANTHLIGRSCSCFGFQIDPRGYGALANCKSAPQLQLNQPKKSARNPWCEKQRACTSCSSCNMLAKRLPGGGSTRTFPSHVT